MLENLKAFFKKKCLTVLRAFKFYRSYSLIPSGEIAFQGLTDIKVLNINKYQSAKRVAPQTTDTRIYWKFEKLLTDTPQSTFLIEANNWHVWGNQGAVITDRGYLFKDVSREFEKPDHSIFKQFKLAPPALLNGTSAVITASGADMYYHWMFDILPRIKLLMDCDLIDSIDQYILDYRDIPFQKEALTTLKIDPAKISRSNDHFKYHVLAERLIVPSLPSKLDVVSTDACRFLVDTFLDKGAASKFGSKIYLKRTGKRELVNKVEIESYLESLGFESVKCENYTVAEQAAIFYNADIIIGPHGAAFTNIVFCKPGTKVIEFFSPMWINPCYWTISNEVSLKYYYLVGEGTPPPDNYSNAKGTNADIQLNPDKLQQLFEQFSILN
jgi:capsular polysaccharide biosynthesis protein